MASIKEIQKLLEQVDQLSDLIFAQFEADSRSGVQKAIQKRQAAIQAEEVEDRRLEQMLTYERSLYTTGVDLIAGIDEVGRGPLAGPVLAAAVILPKNHKIKGLNDSKKIPKSRHQAIYEQVLAEAVAVGIGLVEPETIDQVNIYEATKLAMLQALDNLSTHPQHLLIDAMTLECDLPQTSIIKGDANSLSIAAASIVAKVTRDRLMADYNLVYPGYGFAKNAGYGTKDHLLALNQLGVTPIHRKSFEPIKSMLGE